MTQKISRSCINYRRNEVPTLSLINILVVHSKSLFDSAIYLLYVAIIDTHDGNIIKRLRSGRHYLDNIYMVRMIVPILVQNL